VIWTDTVLVISCLHTLDVHDGTLTYLVVSYRLATLDRDSPALRRPEERARTLALPPRHARRVGAPLSGCCFSLDGGSDVRSHRFTARRLTRLSSDHRPRLGGQRSG
jgi:hypothetical protein